MTKFTINTWSTHECYKCGKPHYNYQGKLDSKGIEYVVCENTNKRMDVSESSLDSIIDATAWILVDSKRSKKNFSVTSYPFHKANPLVILIDRYEGIYEDQFDTVEQLKTYLESCTESVFCVLTANNRKIEGLNSWWGRRLDYERLRKYEKQQEGSSS